MKVSVVAALIALSDLAAAWISCPRPSHHTALTTYSSLPTVLQASRRELIAGAFLASLAAAPQLALADLDYSKIQDLLGNDSSTSYVPEPGKRPSYLTEPTDEFKESEAKSAEFKRKNLQKKQEFAKLLSIIADAPNEEQLLSGALNDMVRGGWMCRGASCCWCPKRVEVRWC